MNTPTALLATDGTIDTAPVSLRLQDMTLADVLQQDTATQKALMREAWTRLQQAERLIAEQNRRIQELEDLASTDPLTKLLNRRGLEVAFEQELSHIQRRNSTGAVLVLIDLDRFKELNDTHGHQAGDACLKVVAENIMGSIRFTDSAARLGGDEFAILLTQTETEKVADRVTTIREVLNRVAFNWQGQDLSCGGSLGMAEVSTEDNGFATAYKKADAALYADKARRKAAGLKR